jgi:hypothetical protein
VQAASIPADQVRPDQQRVRRLFGVLDDLARYASDYTSAPVLSHAWDRISELLLEADPPVVAAAREVSRHRAGSPGWWRAINGVASLLDAAGSGAQPASGSRSTTSS